MKNINKGTVIAIGAVIVVLALIIGGAYYIGQNGNTASPETTSQNSKNNPTSAAQPGSKATNSASVKSTGVYTATVTLQDYLTNKVIPNVDLTMTETVVCTKIPSMVSPQCPKPRVYVARTNLNGGAIFTLPGSNFNLEPFKLYGYLGSPVNFSLLNGDTSNALVLNGKTIKLETVADKGSFGKDIKILVVPISLLKITSKDQAIATAKNDPEINTWLTTHINPTITATEGSGFWQVGFSTTSGLKRLVWVNAFDNSTSVISRWAD